MAAQSKGNIISKVGRSFCTVSIPNFYKQEKNLGIKYHYYTKIKSVTVLEDANCHEGPNDRHGIPVSLSARCR